SRDPVRAVAAEELVGAVTGDRDLYLLCDDLGEEVCRDDACERLVEASEDRADRVREVPELDRRLVMLSAVALRNVSRPAPVVLLLLRRRSYVVRQGERFDRLWRELCGERRREARIDAAAEKEADEHI